RGRPACRCGLPVVVAAVAEGRCRRRGRWPPRRWTTARWDGGAACEAVRGDAPQADCRSGPPAQPAENARQPIEAAVALDGVGYYRSGFAELSAVALRAAVGWGVWGAETLRAGDAPVGHTERGRRAAGASDRSQCHAADA